MVSGEGVLVLKISGDVLGGRRVCGAHVIENIWTHSGRG